MAATSPQASYDIRVSEDVGDFTSRAAFEAFFARWLPCVYRFVARRLATTAEAEAATRAIFTAAIRARIVGEQQEIGARLLILARAEVARRSRASA